MAHNIHPFLIRLLPFGLVLVLFFCLPNLSAQKIKPVVIQGVAEFAKNKEIRLIGFSDLLTYRKKVLAESTINNEGYFKLTYVTPYPQVVQLAIQTSKAEFYIEPEQVYDFTIDMDPQLFQLLDPMTYGGFLQINRNNPPLTPDLNQKISRFEKKYDHLLDYFAPTNIGDMTLPHLDSIRHYLEADFVFQYHPTDFYDTYLFYSWGLLEKIVYQKYTDLLYHKYLDNEYVLYEHPAYMQFLHEFYNNYLRTSIHITQTELRSIINENGTYRSLFNFLGKDDKLVNEKIRELVMIDNLMQLYEDENFSKKNILSILQEIAQQSHFPEHKVMASNAIYMVTHNASGTNFPFPSFIELNGSKFNWKKIENKWIYIHFFNLNCIDCIREMMIIKDLKQKYNDHIEFVSVSLDFHLLNLLKFKEKYPQFDWHFVHFNDQYQWIDDWGISSLPNNILLSPKGKLYNRFAPDISRELPLFLKRQFPTDDQKEELPFK